MVGHLDLSDIVCPQVTPATSDAQMLTIRGTVE